MPDHAAAPVRSALLLSGLVLTASLVALGWAGWPLELVGAPLPPAFVPLLLCSSALTLLVGFRAGHLAFAGCLLLVLVYFGKHPAASPWQSTARSNLLLTLVTLQIFVWSFHSTFRRADRLLREQLRVTQLRLEEHASLVKALVTDITRCLELMRPELRPDRAADCRALRAQQEALTEVIKQARGSLVPAAKAELPPAPVDFRPRMLRWILVINGVETALLALRAFATGRGPPWPAFALSILSFALLALFWHKPAWRVGVAVSLAVACEVAIVSAMFAWGFALPPPGTLFVVTIAYHAILIGWRFSALAIATANVSVVTFVVLQGAAQTLGGRVFLFDVALCALAMPGYWHLMDRRVATALRATERQGKELARIEGFRTRICGTLFHDVANLAQGMGMLVAFDEPLAGEELKSFERLHARLGKLVAATNQTMNEEGPLQAARLSPVPLDDLFRDAQELFAHRLRQKAQSLECSLPEPLAVTAHPDLLRDSVLANLLSNAIKFSPPGTAIRLSAERKQGRVEISVRDQGPGFPDQLAACLERHEKVFSTAGSAGESGLGLGLTLTREHLVRMGGNMTLRRPAGGGGEAVIQLNLA